MRKPKIISQIQGASYLLLIILVVIIISMIIISLQLFSFTQTNQVSQLLATQKAFFGAEGAMYETLQHLRNNPDWPAGSHLEETYAIDGTTIKRTIDDPGAGGNLKIEIIATFQGAKRKLVAEFGKSEATRPPLDIILVLDRSGSMAGQPLNDAKEAAISFIDFLETETNGNKIGLISYSDTAENNQELTSNYNLLRESITNLSTSLYTNIADAGYQAREELDKNGRNQAVKVIVLLSDGVSNRSVADCNSCPDWPCLEPNDNFYPADESGQRLGSCCTHDAVVQANIAKADPRNYIVFSILLNNIPEDECSEDLGRLTLLRISSEPITQPLPASGENYTHYKETKDSSELNKIYTEIAQTVTSLEFFRLHETVPEPD